MLVSASCQRQFPSQLSINFGQMWNICNVPVVPHLLHFAFKNAVELAEYWGHCWEKRNKFLTKKLRNIQVLFLENLSHIRISELQKLKICWKKLWNSDMNLNMFMFWISEMSDFLKSFFGGNILLFFFILTFCNFCGFRWRMQVNKCQGNSSTAAELYLKFIGFTLTHSRCELNETECWNQIKADSKH